MKNNPFPVFKHLTKKEFLLIRERKWDRIQIEIQVGGVWMGKAAVDGKLKKPFAKEGGRRRCLSHFLLCGDVRGRLNWPKPWFYL